MHINQIALMASANSVPRKKPSRGISAWKPPNQTPQMAPSFRVAFLTARPLQMDTAKASILRPTANKNNSKKPIKKYLHRPCGREGTLRASARSVSSFQTRPEKISQYVDRIPRKSADYSLFACIITTKFTNVKIIAKSLHM